MICKKCKKELQDDWVCCPWCGLKCKKDGKKMYQRSDGLYEKMLVINGKRKVFRAKTEKEVMQKIAAFKGEAEVKKTRLFREYADDLEASWDSLAYNSLKGYVPALRRCVDSFGDLPVADITTYQIKLFLDNLGKTYARKTVTTNRNILSQVFDLALLAGDITVNPVDARLKTTGKTTEKRQESTLEDRSLIAAHWDESVISRLAYLIMMTGMRVGEALALNYEDINREKNQIKVSKSVYFVGTTPNIKEPKTKAGIRTIVLLPDVKERYQGTGPIFLNENGQLLRSFEVQRLWDRFRDKYGVKCTFHQLRHSFATTCAEAGVDPKTVQEMMGHSSYIVTDNYTHVRDTMLDSAREKLSYTKNTQ